MTRQDTTALTVLTAVGGEEDDAVAIAVAADLARRHGMTAVVVNAFELMPTAIAGPPFGRAVTTPEVLRVMTGRADTIAHTIDELICRQNRRAGRPVVRLAEPSHSVWATLMRELPLVDLCVLGQSSTSGEGAWSGPLADALMEARAPVYLARDAEPIAGRTAAIAWDGGFEAARAVQAALPLLREASDIAILQDTDRLNTGDGSRADPTRLADWLEARGLRAARYVEAKGGKVGPLLLEAADAVGAALLVAGAYRHSRLREALFGGATRTFLKAAGGPHMLISH